MGVIWLKTKYGKIIHLPIEGEDYNKSTDSTHPSTDILQGVGRAYSERIEVAIPGGGDIVVFNFMAEISLKGKCNQCGQCCTHPIDLCPSSDACKYEVDRIGVHHCKHLLIRELGKPGGAMCELYDEILDWYKSCAYPPDKIHPWMTSCGFKELT